MPCDLHIHSTHSDGSLTPAALIAEAAQLGLTVALTDHNTVSGVPDFLAEAARAGVSAVAGVELSAAVDSRELHILGLFIPPSRLDDVEALTEEYHVKKEESNRALVAKLVANGYAVSYESIQKRSPLGNVNRAHVAAELMALGYVDSVAEAFASLLSEERGFYVPPPRLTAVEAVRFLKRIQAVPVWAHPFLQMDEATVRATLPALLEAGLAGMEVQHSSYDDATILRATAVARDFSLLPSGGSDFHGEVKPDVRLGVGKGNLSVPDAWCDALKQYQQRLSQGGQP